MRYGPFTPPLPRATSALSVNSQALYTPRVRLALHQAHTAYPHVASTTTIRMSNLNLTSLNWITREILADTIQSSPSQSLPANTAIVDVRDSDHVGGHIKGSTWVPSSQLDYKTPELIRTLKDKEVVVFHCALSQQRGPSAALRYLREKERLEGEGVEDGAEEKEGETDEKGQEGEGDGKKKQKVYVLKGGFTEWQEKFGEDPKLTEGYQKDIWEFGN
ncbi:hypothetical protein NX059_004453 [Plenodomus lindquistii]|nr:hypothetical protein NX059_004453 [Plenodomus lindquistii]